MIGAGAMPAMATCRQRSSGAKRYGDPEMIRFVQRFQLRALVKGKRTSAEQAFHERTRALAQSGIPAAAPEPT